MSKLVLASASPRRHVLGRLLVPDLEIDPVDIEEVAPRLIEISDAVQVISRKKALAASKYRPDQWVLAADTVVSQHDELIGKARDEAQARLRLAQLSGHEHRVWTGLALAYNGRFVDDDSVCTRLRMDRLPTSIVDEYITSGQWQGKAGGYGIQDALIAPYMTIIGGPWSNVVGLPIGETRNLLNRNGIQTRSATEADAMSAIS